LRKNNPHFVSTVKVDEIKELEEVKEVLFIKDGFVKIPYSLIEEALSFFRAAFEKYSSEAAVLLVFDRENKEWGIKPIKQTVSGASVDYKVNGERGVCGSIHSHPTFGAFFSGTDDKDDMKLDGFHIVLGRISNSSPEIATSITSNGKRFDCEPALIISDLPDNLGNRKEHPWLNYIEEEEKKSVIDYFGSRKVITDSSKAIEETEKSMEEQSERYEFVSDWRFKNLLSDIMKWPPEKRESLCDEVIALTYDEENGLEDTPEANLLEMDILRKELRQQEIDWGGRCGF